MCGECFSQMHLRQTHPNRFNSYMCGEYFIIHLIISFFGSICFNSYMCGECFVHFDGKNGRKCIVSTHICVGNVSGGRKKGRPLCTGFNSYMRGECFGATKLFWRCYGRRFQLIYVRGMFRGLLMSYPVAFWRFNSYMCGECFTFQTPLALPGFRFNSYMCGECFV